MYIFHWTSDIYYMCVNNNNVMHVNIYVHKIVVIDTMPKTDP